MGPQLGPREGPGLGLGVRQQLMRQVPGAGTGPGLRSALNRVPESALTGVPALAPTRVLAIGLTGVPGLAIALTGVPGLAALGLRLWLGGPRAWRAATRRCARTLALPSRPVISHDPAYPPDDSLSAFT